MPVFSCFRSESSLQHELGDRPRPAHLVNGGRAKSSKSRMLRRQGSSDSQKSNSTTASNDSIARLEPCKKLPEATLEAMMMPLPTERPSRCLRLSQPKTYSNIIDSMKAQRGCRDWRTFDVFYENDIDATMSADELAKVRVADFEKKLRQFDSFDSREGSNRSIEVDMIC